MSALDKNRPRLLVISHSTAIRNDLVTLLTGYGYYVDYVSSRLEGLRAFRHHKHAIAIFDVKSLPRFPERLFRLFTVYRHNPMILIAATHEEETLIYKYLDKGVYDIIQLPLKMEYLNYVFRRMVQFSRMSGQVFYFKTLTIIFLLMTPLWFLLLYLVFRYW